MLKKTTIITISLLLLIANTITYAIETIQLQNRTADEIIPIIQPLLKPKDQLSGKDYRLFINTDRNTLINIIPIIKQLDQAQRSLLITVKFSRQRNHNHHNIALNTDNRQHLSSIKTQNHNDQLPKVRTLEGKRTFIATGQTIPRPSRQITRLGERYIEQDITHLQTIQTGFYATVRLVSEDQFTLEIEPQQQSLNHDQSINHFSLATNIKGELGQWLTAGEIGGQKSNQHYEINTTASGATRTVQTDRRDTIYIKVDLVN